MQKMLRVLPRALVVLVVQALSRSVWQVLTIRLAVARRLQFQVATYNLIMSELSLNTPVL